VQRLSLDRSDALAALVSAKGKLLTERSKRKRPGLDDKVLTSWNGLTIGGLARAGMQLGEPQWIRSAQECADFLRTEVWNGSRLMATWTGGRARHEGYLDDYANLINGLLVLLSAEWREQDAAFALALADTVAENFHDASNGGFYFTAHDHESLIYRPKPTMDDAQPPGNGSIAEALLRLGHLFGEPRYLDLAAGTLSWAREQMNRYPAGHCTMISALALEHVGLEQIIIRGPRGSIGEWLAVSRAGYHPARASFAISWEETRTLPAYLPRLVSADVKSRVLAYRCEGMSCSMPIESLEAFKLALSP
jgi:hypothetical protein